LGILLDNAPSHSGFTQDYDSAFEQDHHLRTHLERRADFEKHVRIIVKERHPDTGAADGFHMARPPTATLAISPNIPSDRQHLINARPGMCSPCLACLSLSTRMVAAGQAIACTTSPTETHMAHAGRRQGWREEPGLLISAVSTNGRAVSASYWIQRWTDDIIAQKR
jgi:hypothetical protein